MVISEIKDELSYLEQLIKEETNFPFVLEKAQSLLEYEIVKQDKSLKAEIDVIIGTSYFYLGNIEASVRHLEGILLFQSEIQKSVYANALIRLGNIYQKQSEFAKSIDYSLRATAIFETEQNYRGLALSYTNIGISYRLLSDFAKSLEFMDKGRRLYLQLDDEAGVAANTGNIGNVYLMMKLYGKSLEYLVLALSINEKVNNLRGIANNCLTIGGVYILTKEYHLAESYLNRALQVYAILQDPTGQMHVQSNIGILLEYQGRFEEAYALHKEVLDYVEKKGDKYSIAIQLVNIGNIYANVASNLHNPQKAEEMFLKAQELQESLDLKNEQCLLHKQLSELYEQLHLWEKSLIHLKQYLDLNESLNSEEAKNKADLLEQKRKLDEMEQMRLLQITRFQEQERMLHKILPNTIADRILEGEKSIVDKANDISIFFSDIVDFTEMTSSMKPEDLINDLNTLFTEFDRIARKHSVEKIKTIGDSYMAVCGIPQQMDDHAMRITNFAFDVLSASKQLKIGNKNVELRIGIHSGEAIAGVIGEDKYSYDLWGDSVNIASRMENSGEKGCIQVTEYFKELLAGNSDIIFISRGEIEIKGKGLMKTFFMHQSNKA